MKGMREGKGEWMSHGGDRYEGDWHNDKKTGKGVFTWANGNIYKGDFKNDMREGDGEMIWKDDSSYKGEWKRGLPNGMGMALVIKALLRSKANCLNLAYSKTTFSSRKSSLTTSDRKREVVCRLLSSPRLLVSAVS